jgi:NAD(P)-dependent dehydrogenase (short-subunit alcohol dehydrogenase family)
MSLDGKVVLVTGAAKGIGKGCAQVLSKHGARIAVADTDAVAGLRTANEIEASGGDAAFLQVDVSKANDVQKMIAQLLERFGQLDILINNAGYHISKNVEDTSEEEWDYILNTNLRSVFLCSKYAIPHLRKTRGAIVNMASMVGLVGQRNAGAYSATKGGIIAMSKGMALDFAKDGIRVNCICPGWVETPLVEDWFSQQADPQAAKRYVYGIHPLGRIATPEEVGNAAVFLCSEQSSFVTGVALPLDGAVTLGY